MWLLADSLFTRYADLSGQPQTLLSGDRFKGSFEYTRTLTPLNHPGENIYRPFFQDALLRDLLRQIKEAPQWHPFRPNPSTTYRYDANGATKNSQRASLRLEYGPTPTHVFGFQTLARYKEQQGPYPNQKTTRIETFSTVSLPLKTRHSATLKLLASDDGGIWETETVCIRTERDIYLKTSTDGVPKPMV